MKTNRFSESFANADAVFNDMYGVELKLLKGLSKEEIDAIIPASNSMQTKNNLAQAQLISKIKDLGSSAIKLAQKIPGWAALF